jgi:hypothetical protein
MTKTGPFLRRILVGALIVATLGLSASPAAARRAQFRANRAKMRAKVRGVVFDWKKKGVTNAKIMIENSKLKRETKTDENGLFAIGIPAGIYRFTVEAHGFKRYLLESLSIRRHSVKRVNVQLEFGEPNDRDLVSPRP